jgi:hypothetical protein
VRLMHDDLGPDILNFNEDVRGRFQAIERPTLFQQVQAASQIDDKLLEVRWVGHRVITGFNRMPSKPQIQNSPSHRGDQAV